MKTLSRSDLIGWHAIMEAKQGNVQPLSALVLSGEELSPEVRDLVSVLLNQKVKRPRHRPPSSATKRRYFEIAVYVRMATRSNEKQHAAVHEATKHFSCSERTIRTALSKADPSEVAEACSVRTKTAEFLNEWRVLNSSVQLWLSDQLNLTVSLSKFRQHAMTQQCTLETLRHRCSHR